MLSSLIVSLTYSLHCLLIFQTCWPNFKQSRVYTTASSNWPTTCSPQVFSLVAFARYLSFTFSTFVCICSVSLVLSLTHARLVVTVIIVAGSNVRWNAGKSDHISDNSHSEPGYSRAWGWWVQKLASEAWALGTGNQGGGVAKTKGFKTTARISCSSQ